MNNHTEDQDDYIEDEGHQLEAGRQAIEQGDYSAALEYLEEYLEEHPLDVETLILAALAAAHLGDSAKAAALYGLVLRLDPGNGTAHHSFGMLLEEVGHFDEALAHFHRARELQPDFPEIYIHTANVLDRLGRTEEALLQYDEALQHLADEGAVYYNRARIFARRGKVRLALRDLRQAAESDRRYLEAARKDASFDAVRNSSSFRRLLA
ncbi:MAG: tetratricopeptide repeat protein [Syntrophotaleaceae bacterium]